MVAPSEGMGVRSSGAMCRALYRLPGGPVAGGPGVPQPQSRVRPPLGAPLVLVRLRAAEHVELARPFVDGLLDRVLQDEHARATEVGARVEPTQVHARAVAMGEAMEDRDGRATEPERMEPEPAAAQEPGRGHLVE